ncbi:MAG: hypothetical protein WBB28_22705 [Crinalium sp.]
MCLFGGQAILALLSVPVLNLLSDSNTEVIFSIVSIWKMQIKDLLIVSIDDKFDCYDIERLW